MAITSKPITIEAGREYHSWATRLSQDLRDLIAEGAAPAFGGIDDFLELSERLSTAMKTGADRASSSGQSTFVIEVPFTDAEQRTLGDMGSSLLSYMEILTLRGKANATPNEAVQEAIAAMMPAEA